MLRVVAVVGLGFAEQRRFSEEEIATYGEDAKTVLTVA